MKFGDPSLGKMIDPNAEGVILTIEEYRKHVKDIRRALGEY